MDEYLEDWGRECTGSLVQIYGSGNGYGKQFGDRDGNGSGGTVYDNSESCKRHILGLVTKYLCHSYPLNENIRISING
jgi:hypothetical protein